MKTVHLQDRIRLLIVDDHLIVRSGLETLLGKEKDIELAGGVASAEAALAFVDTHIVDVMLLDLHMPEINGLDLIEKMLDHPHAPQILILSSFDYEEEIYLAAQRGARGYIMKSSSRAEILAAIRQVFLGQLYFPKQIADVLEQRKKRIGLSHREQDILLMISKGLTNKEIAHSLYISQFTVRNHVNHILIKLDATDRTEAISIAMQQGIIRS